MNLSLARVLVVDDESALRDIFAKWLRQIGCGEVRTAHNGEEAVRIIEETPIDVLITDVRMPVMDGVALVRRLAELDKRIACIIFVSGFGDVDHREMYDLGVEAFLAKPFRLEDLRGALESAIAERRTLWVTPMPVPPRQTVRIDVDAAPEGGRTGEPNSSIEAQTAESFRLGRGGFSARSPEALALGKIAFECHFPNDRPELVGQGYVRWRSRTERTVGIEFAFLDSPGREWIIGEIEDAEPRSFIPAL